MFKKFGDEISYDSGSHVRTFCKGKIHMPNLARFLDFLHFYCNEEMGEGRFGCFGEKK